MSRVTTIICDECGNEVRPRSGHSEEHRLWNAGFLLRGVLREVVLRVAKGGSGDEESLGRVQR